MAKLNMLLGERKLSTKILEAANEEAVLEVFSNEDQA